MIPNSAVQRAYRPVPLILMLIPVLLSLSAGGWAKTDGWKPIYSDKAARRIPSELIGVWEEIGYGRIIVIHDRGYDLYHTTDLLCYRDPSGAGLTLDSRYSFYQLDKKKKQLTLFFHDLGENTDRYQNSERFVRLDRLPTGVVESLDSPQYRTPLFIFDLFWQTFAEQYAFFEQRGIDWAEIRRTYRPRITAQMSYEELYALFVEILTRFDDGHVHLYFGTDRHFKAGNPALLRKLQHDFEKQTAVKDFGIYVSQWADGLKRTVAEDVLKGKVHRAANDAIWWGSIDDRIGYINIYSLTDFSAGGWKTRAQQLQLLDATFDTIFQDFEGKSALILDMTHNQGGFEAATDLIASRFADRKRHVMNMRPNGVAPSQSEKVFVTPSSRKRFLKPVYILTSPVTVSAGESLTVRLKSLPQVKQLGETTRGYLSSILNKPLPAGFAISVSNEFWRSPNGMLYEVRGVTPDIPFDVFPADDLHGGYRKALDRTIQIIREDMTR